MAGFVINPGSAHVKGTDGHAVLLDGSVALPFDMGGGAGRTLYGSTLPGTVEYASGVVAIAADGTRRWHAYVQDATAGKVWSDGSGGAIVAFDQFGGSRTLIHGDGTNGPTLTTGQGETILARLNEAGQWTAAVVLQGRVHALHARGNRGEAILRRTTAAATSWDGKLAPSSTSNGDRFSFDPFTLFPSDAQSPPEGVMLRDIAVLPGGDVAFSAYNGTTAVVNTFGAPHDSTKHLLTVQRNGVALWYSNATSYATFDVSKDGRLLVHAMNVPSTDDNYFGQPITPGAVTAGGGLYAELSRENGLALWVRYPVVHGGGTINETLGPASATDSDSLVVAFEGTSSGVGGVNLDGVAASWESIRATSYAWLKGFDGHHLQPGTTLATVWGHEYRSDGSVVVDVIGPPAPSAYSGGAIWVKPFTITHAESVGVRWNFVSADGNVNTVNIPSTDFTTAPNGQLTYTLMLSLSPEGYWGTYRPAAPDIDPTNDHPLWPVSPDSLQVKEDTTYTGTWYQQWAAPTDGTVEEDPVAAGEEQYVDEPVEPAPAPEPYLLEDDGYFQLRDADTGQWYTTPVVNLTTTKHAANGKHGKGHWWIEAYDKAAWDAWHAAGSPAGQEPEIDPFTCKVHFDSADDWVGNAQSAIRWVNGAGEPGPARSFQVEVLPAYDQPKNLRCIEKDGSMPAILEGGVSEGTFTFDDPDAGEKYYYQIAAGHTAEANEATATDRDSFARRSGQSSSSTVLIHKDTGQRVGVMTVLWTSGKRIRIRVKPDPYVNGTLTGYLRVRDAGDGVLDSSNRFGWSSWKSVTVSVKGVDNPPSAPKPNYMPSINEGANYAEQTFTGTDPDYDAASPQGWELEVALKPYDSYARRQSDGNGIVYTNSRGQVGITIHDVDSNPNDTVDDAHNDLKTVVRAAPDKDFYGAYEFYARWIQKNGKDAPRSPWTKVHGVVRGLADPPSEVFPSTMPSMVSPETVVEQTFYVNDPDSLRTRFEVSTTPNGPWTVQPLTLPGRGTLRFVDAQPVIGKQARMTFTREGQYVGRYDFYIRAIDDSGLKAQRPTRVTGYVAATRLESELLHLRRTPTAATLHSIAPLTIAELSITESLTGPGGATVRVSAESLAEIADDNGMTVRDLLAPGLAEIAVYADGKSVFVGPVVDFTFDNNDLSVSLTLEGLSGHLMRRHIEGMEDYTATGVEQTQLLADLLDYTQRKSYGDLLIGTALTPTPVTRSATFAIGSTIADCYEAVRGSLSGCEWWIEPTDRTLRARMLRGEDRRGHLVLTAANTLVNSSTNSGQLATVVEVVGATSNYGGAPAYAISDPDAPRLELYGRHSARYLAPNLFDPIDCKELANQHRGDHAEPVTTYKLTHIVAVDAEIGPFDYGVGDAITVEVETLIEDLVADVRIINRTINLADGNGYTYTVELDVEEIPRNPDGTPGTIRHPRGTHAPDLYEQLWSLRYATVSTPIAR